MLGEIKSFSMPQNNATKTTSDMYIPPASLNIQAKTGTTKSPYPKRNALK
jgi:hypothetical protein